MLNQTQELAHETRNVGPLQVRTYNLEDTAEHRLIDARIGNNPHIKKFIELYSSLNLVRSIIYRVTVENNFSMVNPVHFMISAYLYTRLAPNMIGEEISNEALYQHVIHYFFDDKHQLYRFTQINKENKEAYYSRFQLRLFRYLKLIVELIGRKKIVM